MSEWISIDDGRRALHVTNCQVLGVHDDRMRRTQEEMAMPGLWVVDLLDLNSHVVHPHTASFDNREDAVAAADTIRAQIAEHA